jgi:3-carboxy-cis,cis-muconate cycloisomerase
MFARGAVAEQVSGRSFVRAMVDVELALVRALVATGLAPAEADLSGFGGNGLELSRAELEQLGRASAEQGTPVPALVRELKRRLGSHPAASQLHRGATSQDIVDTAMMLVAKRALGPMLDDLGHSADTCAELAQRHRGTLQVARTLLQQAVPLTFGLKAARWLNALDWAHRELTEVCGHVLAVQLGGAAGTLAALGDEGLEVAAWLATELELVAPELPWHTDRSRPARLACALAASLGTMGKIARDVVLLAQSEVAELREGSASAAGGRGGSSSMPHKRNPVAAVAVLACAQRAPGLAATVLGAMVQEHERAAGSWQAEWEPLLELLRLAGSAASTLRELLAQLEVDGDRMSRNLEATGGLVMAETAAAVLGEKLGAPRAAEIVTDAARRAAGERRDLTEVLVELAELRAVLTPGELASALAPERYLGSSLALINRALAEHRRASRDRV